MKKIIFFTLLCAIFTIGYSQNYAPFNPVYRNPVTFESYDSQGRTYQQYLNDMLKQAATELDDITNKFQKSVDELNNKLTISYSYYCANGNEIYCHVYGHRFSGIESATITIYNSDDTDHMTIHCEIKNNGFSVGIGPQSGWKLSYRDEIIVKVDTGVENHRETYYVGSSEQMSYSQWSSYKNYLVEEVRNSKTKSICCPTTTYSGYQSYYNPYGSYESVGVARSKDQIEYSRKSIESGLKSAQNSYENFSGPVEKQIYIGIIARYKKQLWELEQESRYAK
jgi:hypothetical protein